MAGFAFTFPWVVQDWTTGQLTQNRTDGELLDPDTDQPVEVFDVNGQMTALKTGPFGTLAPFTSHVRHGIARFGEVRTLVISDGALNSSEQAIQAAADAAAARAAVEAIAETASEIAYFYRDTEGDIWVTGEPVLVGGGVPRLDANGDPVVIFP